MHNIALVILIFNNRILTQKSGLCKKKLLSKQLEMTKWLFRMLLLYLNILGIIFLILFS